MKINHNINLIIPNPTTTTVTSGGNCHNGHIFSFIGQIGIGQSCNCGQLQYFPAGLKPFNSKKS